jgi:hypothetical protein
MIVVLLFISQDRTIIDLDTLMPFSDAMTPEQLERFGDYLRHEEPRQPFTWDEIEGLKKIKENRSHGPSGR